MNQKCFRAFTLRLLACPHALTLLSASLCTLACGNRYEIGDIAAKQAPQQSDGSTNAARKTAPATVSALPRTIIADAYDVDATLAEPASLGRDLVDPSTGGVSFQAGAARMLGTLPLGDVDGDGYGDWAESTDIVYGAPRPKAGGVVAPDRRSFNFAVDGPGLPDGGSVGPAGDINGDGYADLFISYPALFVSATRCAAPGCAAPGATLASQGTRWDAPLTFLVLGGPDRALGPQPPPSGPLPFGDRDELATQFVSELAFDAQNTVNFATQYMYLRSLGDLDHDGFDDFSITTTFLYHNAAFSRSDEPGQLSVLTDQEQRSESVSYLVYGSSSPESSTAAAARLAGINAVYPAGDINGDGFGDLLLVGPDRIYLWSGGAEHASGDLQPELDGLPIDGTAPLPADYSDSTGSVGDLDHDGYADFLVDVASTDDTGASHQLALLFYGGPNIFSTSLAVSSATAAFDLEPFATVQSAGDWNADGYDDLIVDHNDLRRSTVLTETRLLPGTAQRWTGKITLPDDQLAALFTSPEARGPEYVVTPAGDLDGDGFADLLLRRCFPAADPLAPAYSNCDTADTAIKYGGPFPPLPAQIH